MLASVRLMHIWLLIMMTKEFLKLRTNRKLAWLPFAANMLVQANDTPATFHHPMQIMRNYKHSAAQKLRQLIDKLIKPNLSIRVKPLHRLI